jgi:hypothetical protein
MPKWLWGLVLVLSIAAVYWFFRSLGGQSAKEALADSLQTAHQESLAVWTRRIRDLEVISAERDSAIAEAAIEDSINEHRSDLASNTIAQLRHQIRSVTNVRDSLSFYVQLDVQHEARHDADTARIHVLRFQRDALQRDRDDWKRAAGGLLAQLRHDSTTISRLVEMVKDECSYIILKGPCPKLVVGPGVGVTTDGSVNAHIISVTGGIPIRLPGLSGRSPRNILPAVTGSRVDPYPISDLEWARPTDTAPPPAR